MMGDDLRCRITPPTCCACRGPADRKGQRLCRKCHNDYQRTWRKNRISISRETFLGAVNEPPLFVYLIAEEGGEFSKIGVAGDPEDRIQILRSGNGRKLSLFRTWLVASRAQAFGIERITLHTFEHLLGNGEWIRSSPPLVASFVEGFMQPSQETAA